MLWQKAKEFDCTLLWHTNTVRNLGGMVLFSVPGRYFLILPCNWNVRGGTLMIQKSHKRETLWENICFSVPKWPFTWLWMYLVCRPCSSTPSPSTSALYLGLMATMISTDFCQNNPHCQFFSTAVIRVEDLPNQTRSSHLHHSGNGPSIGWYPCFGLNCQTCRAEERQSEWEHLKWSEHLREIKGWWMSGLTEGLKPWSTRNLTKMNISLAMSTEYVIKTLPVNEVGEKQKTKTPSVIILNRRETWNRREWCMLWHMVGLTALLGKTDGPPDLLRVWSCACKVGATHADLMHHV